MWYKHVDVAFAIPDNNFNVNNLYAFQVQNVLLLTENYRNAQSYIYNLANPNGFKKEMITICRVVPQKTE